mgnify:CR=1 FL=1
MRTPSTSVRADDRNPASATGSSPKASVSHSSGMVPLRSVPHRVVVLLGMDDGAFPRLGRSQGLLQKGVALFPVPIAFTVNQQDFAQKRFEVDHHLAIADFFDVGVGLL